MSFIDEHYVAKWMLDHLSHISSANCVSDLGEGFIAACLGAFGDDVETVVHRILEGSLRT